MNSKNNLSVWQFAGFALSSLFGTLLHFLYDFTNKSVFVAPFSGVNESTWEHMKLLFFPLLLFAIFQSFFFKDYKNFWCVKLLSTLLGIIAIPVLFYTYNGVIGKSPDWINISIFFVSAAIVFIVETILFKNDVLRCKYNIFALFALLVVGLLFILFTFYTPHIAIFKDAVSGGYGIA